MALMPWALTPFRVLLGAVNEEMDNVIEKHALDDNNTDVAEDGSVHDAGQRMGADRGRHPPVWVRADAALVPRVALRAPD